jgi:lipopolysaccharide export system permease protein
VKLVTRYVVREHVGPLLFALSALTSLLMLQYVARQLGNLAGKGLPWGAVGEFFVLSLPFTIAMTIPMAVLVATLFVFGRMAAEHEITAFKASGVRVRTLMAPVVWAAFLLSLAMVVFNDQVLPRANHRLRILQADIGKTRPTLALRDQALNALTPQVYLRLARSDAATSRMWDVVLYDLTKSPERVTTYADSGRFSVAANGDLQLTLFTGRSQQFAQGDPRRLQRSAFREQVVLVRGIAKGFEATASDDYKGDREMTVCEMHRRYLYNAAEHQRYRKDYIAAASQVARPGAKTIVVPRDRPPREPLAAFYCKVLPGLVSRLAAPRALKAQPPVAQPPVAQPPVAPAPVDSAARPAGDRAAAQPQPAAPDSTPPVAPAAPLPPAPSTGMATGMLDSASYVQGLAMTAQQQLLTARRGLDTLAVEVHKKFALSFACLVFVLFGPPIALRFPRGGAGVTIGVSIVVFGLYYICLMAGEVLADEGRLPAFVAMWMANVLFGGAGVVLMLRAERTVDTSRGGGVGEWWATWRAARRARRAAARAGAGA